MASDMDYLGIVAPAAAPIFEPLSTRANEALSNCTLCLQLVPAELFPLLFQALTDLRREGRWGRRDLTTEGSIAYSMEPSLVRGLSSKSAKRGRFVERSAGSRGCLCAISSYCICIL